MKMLTYVLGAKTLTRDFPKTYFIMTENMINHRGGWGCGGNFGKLMCRYCSRLNLYSEDVSGYLL